MHHSVSRPRILALLFLFFLLQLENSFATTPIVLMHGLLSSVHGLVHVEHWLREDFPDAHIVLCEIGNGVDDSLFMNINQQVRELNSCLISDPLLANGFNGIGHSQGGLLLRAYIERYNNPPVKKFISWAGIQMGVYGVPKWNAWCPDDICHLVDDIFDKMLEDPNFSVAIQDNFSFAAYWRDVMHYEKYLKGNRFLADINNEVHFNATYKRNFESLEQVLLIYSSVDQIVVPRKSPIFSFFPVNSTETVVPWDQLQVSKLIGLDTLVSQDKVIFHSVPCAHSDITRDVCKEWYTKYTKPLLS